MQFWTPIVGPTATLMAARWARDAKRTTTPAQWPIDALAATFGVQPAVAWRAVGRLERFGIICRRDDAVAVRLLLPPLPMRLRARLPDHLAVEYEAFLRLACQPR